MSWNDSYHIGLDMGPDTEDSCHSQTSTTTPTLQPDTTESDQLQQSADTVDGLQHQHGDSQPQTQADTSGVSLPAPKTVRRARSTLHGSEVLTHSRMSCYQQCEWKHYLRYELGLVPDRDAPPLRFGTAFHKALELQSLGAPTDTITAAIMGSYSICPTWEDPTDYACEAESVRVLAEAHEKMYPEDDAGRPEWMFHFKLTNPDSGKQTPLWTVSGKVDQKFHDMMREYKTTSDDISEEQSDYWQRLRFDSQVSMYLLAMMWAGHGVCSAEYDVTRKPTIKPKHATPIESRKRKADGALYANQRERDETPEEWADRLTADVNSRPMWYFQRRIVRRSEPELMAQWRKIWNLAQRIRKSELDNVWLQNDRACNIFGRCPYFAICTQGLHPVAGDCPDGYRVEENLHPELTGEK